MRYTLFGILIVTIVVINCDVMQSNKNETELIEKQGETLLPTIEKDHFILGNWFGGEQKSKSVDATVSWEEIETVLDLANQQTGEELIAVFSVRDSTRELYNYYLQPLEFSPAAMEEAGDKTRFFIYEINPDESGLVPRIAIARIPDSKLAYIEMKYWIVPQFDSFRQANMPELKNKSDFYCEAVIEVQGGRACWDDPAEFCTYYQPIYNVVCEGPPSGNNDGSDLPNWDWPMGGGSGEIGGGSSGGASNGENCRPPYGCGELIYYYGIIDIDSSIFEDAKVTCVLDNLLNNGNTLAETILKFADASIDLDLKIELVEIHDNSLGHLISQGNSSVFTLQIDKSNAQQRLPIQIATTIMHEAIHAEMRRFLYDATDTSTLPGFPGSFTGDWEAYVRAQNGSSFEDQVNSTEHNIMAQNYIDIIVSGLRDFDNNSLSTSLYEALAWEGLIHTQAYSNLNLSQRNRLGTDYQAALNQSSPTCN